jgi:hypothetical protein
MGDAWLRVSCVRSQFCKWGQLAVQLQELAADGMRMLMLLWEPLQELSSMMNKEYKHGWHIAMEYDEFPLGLSEDIVRAISAVKDEPQWLLEFRLRAYRRWLTMEEPEWSDNRFVYTRRYCPGGIRSQCYVCTSGDALHTQMPQLSQPRC